MNLHIMDAVYHCTADLTAIETLVLYTLAGAAGSNDAMSSPSINLIADRAGLSKGAVVKATKSLQRKGILEIQKRRTAKGQMGNLYIFHTDKFGRETPVTEPEWVVKSDIFKKEGNHQTNVINKKGEQSMSGRLVHKAIHKEGLSSTEKLVLVALADYADDATRECSPSQSELAGLLSMTRKSVNQMIGRLCDEGVVAKIGFDGHACQYKIFPEDESKSPYQRMLKIWNNTIHRALGRCPCFVPSDS
jgi:DNA-binding MarR family transcriptional regulator